MRESAIATEGTKAEPKGLRLVTGVFPKDLPSLEAELERAKEKTGARWPVDYVLNAIMLGHAAAFRVTEDGSHLAWLVVERLSTYEVALNVWVMVGAGLGMHHRDGIVALLDELAQRVGAKLWRAEGREGWMRVLHGVSTRTHTVYEREIR